MKDMKFTTCDFCEHHTGPYKDTPLECVTCIKHGNFQIKKNMHPRMEIEWNRMIDRVIEARDRTAGFDHVVEIYGVDAAMKWLEKQMVDSFVEQYYGKD